MNQSYKMEPKRLDDYLTQKVSFFLRKFKKDEKRDKKDPDVISLM
jgi:hypothetical protein